MSIRLVGVLAALALCGCAAHPRNALRPAAALKFAQGPGPYNFDCNAPAGDYTQLNAHILAENVQVTGSFQILKVRTDRKWAPSVAIFVDGMPGSIGAGLSAYVVPKGPKKTMYISLARGVSSPKRDVFAKVPLTSAAIPFVMTLYAGRMSLSVGGLASPVAAPVAAITRLGISCSTARVRFANVTISAIR